MYQFVNSWESRTEVQSKTAAIIGKAKAAGNKKWWCYWCHDCHHAERVMIPSKAYPAPTRKCAKCQRPYSGNSAYVRILAFGSILFKCGECYDSVRKTYAKGK